MHGVSCHKTLGLHSEWINESQVRVKTRTIGHSGKIAVDLTVLSPQVTYAEIDFATLRKIACDQAVLHGSVICKDYTLLRDFAVDRTTHRLDGTELVTNVREVSFAFQGA